MFIHTIYKDRGHSFSCACIFFCLAVSTSDCPPSSLPVQVLDALSLPSPSLTCHTHILCHRDSSDIYSSSHINSFTEALFPFIIMIIIINTNTHTDTHTQPSPLSAWASSTSQGRTRGSGRTYPHTYTHSHTSTLQVT